WRPGHTDAPWWRAARPAALGDHRAGLAHARRAPRPDERRGIRRYHRRHLAWWPPGAARPRPGCGRSPAGNPRCPRIRTALGLARAAAAPGIAHGAGGEHRAAADPRRTDLSD